MKINFDTDYEAYELTVSADLADNITFKAVFTRDAPNCADFKWYYIGEEYFETRPDLFWNVYLKTVDNDFISINRLVEMAHEYALNFKTYREEYDRQKAHAAGE